MNGIKKEINSLNESMLSHPQGQTTEDCNKIEIKHGVTVTLH